MPSRSHFLAAGAGVVAVVATSVKADAAIPAPAPSWSRAAFEARLNLPYRHRQVFAMRDLAGGAVFHWMRNALNGYQFEMGDGPGTLHVAAVMYSGGGVATAFDDYIWKTYGLAEIVTGTFADRVERQPGQFPDAATQNPFWHARSSLDLGARRGAGSIYVDESMQALASQGASFFCCNNTVLQYASLIAAGPHAGGKNADEIRRELLAHMVPGSMLVPAGVSALIAAQEAHFTFAPG